MPEAARGYSWQVSFCPGNGGKCGRRNNSGPRITRTHNPLGVRCSVSYDCTRGHAWTLSWQEET